MAGSVRLRKYPQPAAAELANKTPNQQESRLCLGAQVSREQTDQLGEANQRSRVLYLCVSAQTNAVPSD